MRVGNLVSGAGALRQAQKLLRLRWAATKSEWNDSVSQEFEEKYIDDLLQQSQQTIEQIARLAQALGKCYQECSE